MARLKEPIPITWTYYPFQRYVYTTRMVFLVFVVSRERNVTVIIVTCGPHPSGWYNPLKDILHVRYHLLKWFLKYTIDQVDNDFPTGI